ncbi:MAG TPA: hypothetical protein VN946_20125 [Terriglobales bacterium]|jgi:hypothetical protein|nr:hypothetical protein [Terriglobales bacterium]
MRGLLITRGPWPWFIAITGFVLFLSVYLLLDGGKKATAPAAPVISSCKKLGPGMRRIEVGPVKFHFDVPVERFTVKCGVPDAPVGPYGGCAFQPKNSLSLLNISWDPEASMKGMQPNLDPALVYSGPVVSRKILDDDGNTIGEDSWGYWGKGEFWRRVRLRGSVVARYGSINAGGTASDGSVQKKDAELFDHVINSVCILSGPSS